MLIYVAPDSLQASINAMSSLQKALDSIQALSPNERASLRELLNSEKPTEADFAERMVALGVLERQGRRASDFEFEPVPTEGSPASEIIIEERR